MGRNQPIDPRRGRRPSNDPPLSRKEQKLQAKEEKKRQRLEYASEYYENESRANIEIASLKKARKYNVIAIFFLILVIIGCLFYLLVIQQSAKGEESLCWSYQVRAEQMASQYVAVHGFSSNPAYIEDIPEYGEGPVCPVGGTYTWNPITGIFVCSEHGHHPDTFAQPESEIKSTTQTQTNSNSTRN